MLNGNTKLVNKDGKTELDLDRTNGHTDIVKLLNTRR